MRTFKASNSVWLVLAAFILFQAIACGGGSSSSTPSQQTQTGNLSVTISDDSTEDWATIGVKVNSISLIPQGGGSDVSVVSFTSPVSLNLVQLDQLGELLANASVPTGTYIGARLTLSGNPGDVTLVASSDPESGFAASAGQTIPSNQIIIQGTTGSAGSLTVPVNITFSTPLVVTSGSTNAIDIDFDLSHPAFIIDHVTTGGTTIWAVNFTGPVRYQVVRDITALLLRHIYGQVASVSSDNSAITITRVFPAKPATSPETAVASSQSLQILADSTNGTIVYDMDLKSRATVKDFSSLTTTLPRKYVRVAARYQQNGTLVAARIWTSTSFNTVWISPEGHVLHTNTSANTITVENEDGVPVLIQIDSNTQFFFRTPANALSDSTPIATGTAFLADKNIVRGFKVHTSVVDPTATPMVAQTVDIEIAKFDGVISAANQTGFVYTRNFATASDNYSVTTNYISSTTANGKDSSGNSIQGFKWWNFAFPTQVDSGTNAIADFVSATSGTVNFGGTIGTLKVRGVSSTIWNDQANPPAWAAKWAVLTPVKIPLATVTSGFSGNTFVITALEGANPVSVNVSATSGSATLVYQIDRTNGVVTISPIDITSASGLSTVTSNLHAGVPVKVFGVPQSNGTVNAYSVFYYTGTKPSN